MKTALLFLSLTLLGTVIQAKDYYSYDNFGRYSGRYNVHRNGTIYQYGRYGSYEGRYVPSMSKYNNNLYRYDARGIYNGYFQNPGPALYGR